MQRITILTAVAVLALAGCKSTEQQRQDLNAELHSVAAQYNKDCPKFDENDTTGISAALGTKPSPSQTAATAQRQQKIQANLHSPHCKELDARQDDLMRKLLGLQKQ
jgi:Prokaryotic membrane lipoprotein lipid attachment site